MFSHLYLISTSLVLAQLVSRIEGNILKVPFFSHQRKFPKNLTSTLIANDLMKFEVDKSLGRNFFRWTGHNSCKLPHDLSENIVNFKSNFKQQR